MTKIGLKTRVLLIFATMLAVGMFLQSIIVIFLGVRTSIREDIMWAQNFIKKVVVPSPSTEEKAGRLSPDSGMSYDRREGVRSVVGFTRL